MEQAEIFARLIRFEPLRRDEVQTDPLRKGGMSGTLINIIIQLIACASGGNVVGAVAKDVSLRATSNTVAGAVGGVADG
jgi:hypothetical protein